MRNIVLLLALCLALVAGKPQRIVGGSITTINDYPYSAAMLYAENTATFSQSCGGSILNNRAVLSAAHCFIGNTAFHWRIRVGSSFGNTGGTVYQVSRINRHPSFNSRTMDNDIATLIIGVAFNFGSTVQPCTISGPTYNLADNQSVWAIGWGVTSFGGQLSTQLRHVEIWVVNQNTCIQRYNEIYYTITDNMLCAGYLDVGGRDHCQGDSGGPLIHNNVVVGVCSWGIRCGDARYPGVNTRVSRYTSWIQENA